MKQALSNSDLVKLGEMTLPPWDLSTEAYAVWELGRQQRMRKRLAEKGQPISKD